MTTANRSKAGTSSASSSTTADETSTTAVPAETEAPMDGDTSAPAPLDTPADSAPIAAAAPTPAAAAAPAPAAAPGEALTVEQTEFRKGRVAIKLSHPISGIENYRRLRLDSDPDRPDVDLGYSVGATIWVVPDDARAVIMSGYAQVDPENQAAVRAAVRGETAPAATV